MNYENFNCNEYIRPLAPSNLEGELKNGNGNVKVKVKVKVKIYY